MKSLISDGMHYIKNGDGGDELYNFEKNTWEQDDLARTEDGRRMLEQFRLALFRPLETSYDGQPIAHVKP